MKSKLSHYPYNRPQYEWDKIRLEETFGEYYSKYNTETIDNPYTYEEKPGVEGEQYYQLEFKSDKKAWLLWDKDRKKPYKDSSINIPYDTYTAYNIELGIEKYDEYKEVRYKFWPKEECMNYAIPGAVLYGPYKTIHNIYKGLDVFEDYIKVEGRENVYTGKNTNTILYWNSCPQDFWTKLFEKNTSGTGTGDENGQYLILDGEKWYMNVEWITLGDERVKNYHWNVNSSLTNTSNTSCRYLEPEKHTFPKDTVVTCRYVINRTNPKITEEEMLEKTPDEKGGILVYWDNKTHIEIIDENTIRFYSLNQSEEHNYVNYTEPKYDAVGIQLSW